MTLVCLSVPHPHLPQSSAFSSQATQLTSGHPKQHWRGSTQLLPDRPVRPTHPPLVNKSMIQAMWVHTEDKESSMHLG